MFLRLKPFFTSSTARLSGTYLAIIMIMSLGFSVVLYNASSQQLGRQLPRDSGFTTSPQERITHTPQLDQFLQERIQEGRDALLVRLIVLNVVSLVAGAGVSYVLARRTLRPIEEAMEAQVQFVSDASHELRTPLTAIQTSNEVFLRRSKPTLTDAKKLIEQNTDDVIRLKQLSDGLLSLAQHRQAHTRLQTVSLQSVVSDAMTQVVPQVTAKNITIHDEVANVYVTAEPATLAQALVILLDNAVKYSDSNKNISLTTRVRSKAVYLDVTDEGIGIRASDIPHLFRRFYRADNARTGGERAGYGLGLSIAQQIMHSQNGAIEVTSTLGKGSRFSLKLALNIES